MGVGRAQGQSRLLMGPHIMANGQTTAFMETVSLLRATIPYLPGAHITGSGARKIHNCMAKVPFRSLMARFTREGG